MAIDDNLARSINDQIALELSSAYVYLAMSAQFEADNLGGFANWMRVQTQEELAHAMRLYTFLVDRGGRVKLQAIKEPPADFGAIVEMIEGVLEHERKVTASINDLYAKAVKLNDRSTQVHLNWFIDEQVEEEKQAEDLLVQVKMVQDDPSGLLMLDRELAQRKAGEGEAE